MAQHELLVKLGLQSDSFTRNLKNVNNQLKLTEAEFKKLETSTINFGSSQKDLESKLNSLKDTKEKLTAKTLLYQNKIKDLNSEVEKSKTKHEQITEKLNKEKKKLEELSLTQSKSSNAYKEQAEKVKNLQVQHDKSKKKIENLNLSLQKHQIELTKTETSLLKVKNAISQTKFEKLTLGATQLSDKLTTLSGKLDVISQKTGVMGTVLTAGITTPIVGATKSVITFGMEFESSMSKVKALSGANKQELEQLEAKAREMGKATSFTAKDAADGLGYMALAGWDTKQMLEGIEPVLRLAEAGNLDLATTSDLVTDSMSSLGLEVSDLSEYLDKIARASARSNTDIDQMLRTYNQVGGTFDRLNVPLEESGALIGILANRGLKAEQAGRATSSLLINLTGGSESAAKAMKALGVNAYDSKGKFKGVEKVLTELHGELYKVEDGTRKYTDAQVDNYLRMIGGKTQIRTLDAMLNGVTKTTEEGTTEFRALKKELVESEGALQDMANVMKDNLQGDWEKLTSAVGELALQFWDLLQPALRDITQKFTDLVQKFIDMDDKSKLFIVKMAAIAAAAGPVLLAISGVAKVLSVLTGGFGKVITKIISFGGKAKQVFNLVKGGTGIFKALSTVFVGLPAAIGIAVGALATIGAVVGENETALARLQEKFGTFGTIVSGVCEFLSGVFQLVFGGLVNTLGTIGKVLVKVFTGQWKDIDDVIREGSAKAEMNATKAFDNMAMSSTRAISKMREMTSQDMEGLVDDMQFILDKLPNISFDTADKAAQEFANGLSHLDNNAIEILSSTSENMNMLFKGIREGMNNEQATAIYQKNLETMCEAGGVSTEELKREIERTLNLINDNMADSGDRFAREAKVAMEKFGLVSTQGIDQAAGDIASHLSGLNVNTVEELRSMGNDWAVVFKNISTDGSMTTKEMTTIIEDNIRRMAKNNPKFIEELQLEMKEYFDKLPEDAKNSLLLLEQEVATGSQNAKDASAGTGADIEKNLEFDASTKTSEELTNAQNVINGAKDPLKSAANTLGVEASAGFNEGLDGLTTGTSIKMSEHLTSVQNSGQQTKQAMQQNAIDSVEGFITTWDANSGRINESINNTFDNVSRLTKLDWSITLAGLDNLVGRLNNVAEKAENTRANLSKIAQVDLRTTADRLNSIKDALTKVASNAKTANSNLSNLSKVNVNTSVSSLERQNTKLVDMKNKASSATNNMKKLAGIKMTELISYLDKINTRLGDSGTKTNTARDALSKLNNLTFNGLVSRLTTVANVLSTVVSRANSAKTSVKSISAAVPSISLVRTTVAVPAQAIADKMDILSRERTDLSQYNMSRTYLNKSNAIQNGVSTSGSAKKEDNSLLESVLKQNELLISLLSANKDIVIHNELTVDGRNIAKSTAKYMSNEINAINSRKNRLAGI